MKWLNGQELDKQKEYYATTVDFNSKILKKCILVFNERLSNLTNSIEISDAAAGAAGEETASNEAATSVTSSEFEDQSD